MDGFQRDAVSGNCVDIDECTEIGCDEDNTYCVNTLGSYDCNCESGFERMFGICSDIDECKIPEKADSCGNGMCINIPGGFKCECNHGYELSTDATCINVDECATGNPCLANESCFDTDGHFFCCQQGHSFVDGNCVNAECADVSCNDDQVCRDGVCYCKNIYQEVRDGTI